MIPHGIYNFTVLGGYDYLNISVIFSLLHRFNLGVGSSMVVNYTFRSYHRSVANI